MLATYNNQRWALHNISDGHLDFVWNRARKTSKLPIASFSVLINDILSPRITVNIASSCCCMDIPQQRTEMDINLLYLI